MPLDPQRNPLDGLRSMMLNGATPVTNTILALNVATAVLAFFVPAIMAFLGAFAALIPLNALVEPWTLLTYPFVNFIPPHNPNALFNLVICSFFFMMSGGSLERSWGSRTYLWFFIVLGIVSGLSVSIGAALLNHFGKLDDDTAVYGFFLPLVATIVAFCSIDPEREMFGFFIPMKAKYIAIISVAAAWITFGAALGLFACGGSLAAYLWVRNGRPWATEGYKQKARPRGEIIDFQAARKRKSNAVYLDGSIRRSPFDIRGRWRDMQERKKLARLLKNSGLLDPEDRR